MEKDKSNSGRADVRLIDGRYILCVLSGFIDAKVSENSMAETGRLSNQLRASGRPVYLLIDGGAVTGQDSGARLSTRALGSMGIKKIAVCGKNITTVLVAQYLMRASRVTDKAKAFRSRKKAERWLLHEPKETDRDMVRVLVGSFIVAALAFTALIGWTFNDKVLTEFLPHIIVMNPVVAVTFLLLSLAVLLVMNFLKHNKGVRRRISTVIVGFIILWTVMLSVSVWLRAVWGIELRLDRWLFVDRVGTDAFAAVRTVMNFMLVMVMLLAALTGQKRTWQRLVFNVTWWIIYFNTVLVALGYAYGFSLADITSYTPMPLTTALCFMALIYSIRPLAQPLPFFAQAQSYFDKHQFSIAVCAIGVVISGILWQQSKLDLEHNVSNQVSDTFKKTQSSLTSRIASYTSLLYGTRSLFEASDNVSPDEFTVYFASSEVETYLPGLNGMAYVGRVAAADKRSYQNEIRKKATTLNPQLSQFTFHPAVSQPESYVITYIEPNKTNVKESLGYDLASSDQRRVVLEAARDTGDIKTTETININTAVQGAAPDRPGIFMTAPIYSDEKIYGEPSTVQDRRDRLIGFVNASFVYSELFGDVFSKETAKNVRYVISDTETGTTLYTYNSEATDIGSQVRYEGNLDFGGRPWTLMMYTNDTFGSTDAERLLPPVVLVGGLALTALVTALASSISRKREGAVIMAEAMTEDLNNERDLAVAARNKNDTILASIGDAVFVVDDKERITLFNRAAETISGYSAKEAIGSPYNEILKFVCDDANVKCADMFIKRALKGQLTHLGNHKYLVRKDGKKVAVADSAAPVRDKMNGKVSGAIIVFRDVTRETELNRAKDEFVSLASHQLRTPLSAVKWYSEMLLAGDAGKLSKTQVEYVHQMYDGNERMIDLVNSLLNVSRIDLGKFVNEPENVSISKLISSLESEMSEQIRSKKLKISIKLAHDSSEIHIDPKLLRAIVQNLLSNSVKYTTDGGKVDIAVRLARVDECKKAGIHKTGKYIFISVADNGRGIPKSQHGRIFEKLFRADNVRAMDVEGTGLGLYIVQQLVEKLGGKIWFDSQENVGSTFYVILPAHTQRITFDQAKITAKGADKTNEHKS